MKLKSLILGSVAAAGLSTAGYAADLGVLTSLDVCDSLGISGLTLSSSDNCLQITGGVSYEFGIGQFRNEGVVAETHDSRKVPVALNGEQWDSRTISWIKAVGTAASDFGPASATIKLKSDQRFRTTGTPRTTTNTEKEFVFIDEAFVQVGDTTTIMAGKKGSIANLGDDAPFNFLGLFNSASIDGAGVGLDGDSDLLGGNVIQVVSEVADGVKVGLGFEALGNDVNVAGKRPGTVVGVVEYAGEGITAHLTAAAFEVLNSNVESWMLHAGVTSQFDAFKVRAAVSYLNKSLIGGANYLGYNHLNALISAEGKFDLFTIAASAEVLNVSNRPAGDFTDYGFGASAGFAVTEGVSINLGARYFHAGVENLNTTQVSAQLVAALTETIKATAEIGGYFGDKIQAQKAAGVFKNDNVIYGTVGLAWAPGGGFTSSLEGTVNSENAYKVTFKAAKEFK
ncbi:MULTISPECIES: hypothetical protein [unclassified Devosia]|uniref:hypothetical protein n=1 Tax=unclassified Devosia TaxID=196773 RepID=UPI00145D3D2C|nr:MULTISPECIES: hypothetical protein [unclassified Devosia]MBJ6986800.1 hypothetical protein [Devosia sp. MC521]MBK1795635.1 hypothetical protein [Devosia sp. WQ 349K1]QMW63835.1 hypothetical protein H4N61_05800 [Devosia sp. MC521]